MTGARTEVCYRRSPEDKPDICEVFFREFLAWSSCRAGCHFANRKLQTQMPELLDSMHPAPVGFHRTLEKFY
jgi:hypothetical protein